MPKQNLIYLLILSVICEVRNLNSLSEVSSAGYFALTDSNTDFLADQIFSGTYDKNSEGPLFDYIDSGSGKMHVILYNDPQKTAGPVINSINVFIFDPIYHDMKFVAMRFDLDKASDDGIWNKTDIPIKVTKFFKQRPGDDESYQNNSYRISASNLDTNDAEKVKIQIQIKGSNLDIQATLEYENKTLSTLGYCLYVSAVVGLQIFCSLMILKEARNGQNQSITNKMSLMTLSICNIEDFYNSMRHIQFIMSSGTAYLLYILPALTYIVLFVIFDMKMLFLVWKGQNMRQFDNPQALRKKLTIFYLQFYFGLFVYLTLTYFFSFDFWLILLQHFYLLPQIIHNARIGTNPGFLPFYIFGYLGTRLLIPLYERACPQNHFMLTPIPSLVVTIFTLAGIQMLILYVQWKLGSRFFIPKALLPDYYNYVTKLKLNEETKAIDCTICLQSLFSSIEDGTNDSIITTLVEEVKVMKTPCNHYFHRQCLEKWVDVKLQCPSCRKKLPPFP